MIYMVEVKGKDKGKGEGCLQMILIFGRNSFLGTNNFLPNGV